MAPTLQSTSSNEFRQNSCRSIGWRGAVTVSNQKSSILPKLLFLRARLVLLKEGGSYRRKLEGPIRKHTFLPDSICASVNGIGPTILYATPYNDLRLPWQNVHKEWLSLDVSKTADPNALHPRVLNLKHVHISNSPCNFSHLLRWITGPQPGAQRRSPLFSKGEWCFAPESPLLKRTGLRPKMNQTCFPFTRRPQDVPQSFMERRPSLYDLTVLGDMVK